MCERGELRLNTYNEEKHNDIPRCINNVHLPANVCQGDVHEKHQHQPVLTTSAKPSHTHKDTIPKEVITENQDSRKSIQCQLRHSDAIRTNRVIKHLGRIQVQQRRPRNRVKALKQKHDSNITIDQTLRCAIWVVGIQLGESTNNEQAGNEQRLGDEGGGFAAPIGGEVGAEEAACETPDVEDDVLFLDRDS